MSTLSVGTIKSISTTAPVFQNSSGTEKGTLCLAWVNFIGTGTVAIRDSFNISSITDNATGKFTATFTNALTNNDYVFTGSAAQADEDHVNPNYCFPMEHDSKYLTTGFKFRTGYQSGGTSVTADRSVTLVAIFGDS